MAGQACSCPRNRHGRWQRWAVEVDVERTGVSVIDAIGRGTGEGLRCALNVERAMRDLVPGADRARQRPARRGRGCDGMRQWLGVGGGPAQQSRGGRPRRSRGACGAMARRADHRRGLLGAPRGAERGSIAYAAASSGPLRNSLDPKSRFTIATYALCGCASFQLDRHPDRHRSRRRHERRHDLARPRRRARCWPGTFANFVRHHHRHAALTAGNHRPCCAGSTGRSSAGFLTCGSSTYWPGTGPKRQQRARRLPARQAQPFRGGRRGFR